MPVSEQMPDIKYIPVSAHMSYIDNMPASEKKKFVVPNFDTEEEIFLEEKKTPAYKHIPIKDQKRCTWSIYTT